MRKGHNRTEEMNRKKIRMGNGNFFPLNTHCIFAHKFSLFEYIVSVLAAAAAAAVTQHQRLNNCSLLSNLFDCKSAETHSEYCKVCRCRWVERTENYAFFAGSDRKGASFRSGKIDAYNVNGSKFPLDRAECSQLCVSLLCTFSLLLLVSCRFKPNTQTKLGEMHRFLRSLALIQARCPNRYGFRRRSSYDEFVHWPISYSIFSFVRFWRIKSFSFSSYYCNEHMQRSVVWLDLMTWPISVPWWTCGMATGCERRNDRKQNREFNEPICDVT